MVRPTPSPPCIGQRGRYPSNIFRALILKDLINSAQLECFNQQGKIMKTILLSTLLLITSVASATLEQVWQVDISSYWGTYQPNDWKDAILCSDGYTIIGASSFDWDGYCLLVIDKDGNYVDRDIFTDYP
jgi:hypothetical protein